MSRILNYDSKEYKQKCRGVRHQLTLRGIKYRIYDQVNCGVRVTVCVGKLPNGKNIRGLAFCSEEDNFCRAVGQYYSMVRVLKSAARERHCCAVTRDEVYARFNDGVPIYKGFWGVGLTQQEETMFTESAS